jgi:hypothetical protein
MARLTKWDAVRGCYVIVPDSTQNHIQKLGELEDRAEGKKMVASGTHSNSNGEITYPIMRCGWCRKPVEEPSYSFCPYCGWKLNRSEDEQ